MKSKRAPPLHPKIGVILVGVAVHGALVRLTSSSKKNPRLVWRAARACAAKPALSSLSLFLEKSVKPHRNTRHGGAL
jgi:hypothetical protein